MWCKTCGEAYEQRRPKQTYCRPECRPHRFRNMDRKDSAAARGYGSEHRKLRAQWKPRVDAGQVACALCGYLIASGEAWHLDHTPDRTAYRGPAHAECNRRDGARRGNRRSQQNATEIF
jgi:hypothetical protein